MGDIRIWNVQMKLELLRIQVPNLNCLCFTINSIGSTIVSGWDDGKIRAFFPESGKMKFVIPDAHSDNVTSLAIANDIVNSSVHQIISGGSEGRLRVWDVTSSHQALKMSLKEHRGAINCIKINTDNTQCISASSDGSCIVWDLKRFVRVNAFFESNVFYSVLYHPDESQIITCGSNHKITYWDSVDGQAIRVIDGGDSIMTCLDVDDFGNYFVSGSEDRKVKIWHYDNGIPLAIGEGHSGILKSIQISPDCKSIASVGSSGEIIIWDMSPFRSESALI
jgi:WD40 repeat protein